MKRAMVTVNLLSFRMLFSNEEGTLCFLKSGL